MHDKARPAETRDSLLSFWFSDEARARWFDATPAFDATIRERFLGLHEAAASGALDGWLDDPRGCLALVLLLDQMPRNAFRDTARAYATDALARRVADEALARGFDAELSQPERMFLYLPFEHSEDPADQERCVALMADLDADPRWAAYARKHRDVIARFGRFPHRNAVLGRPSTEDEAAFLAENGAGW